MSQVDLSIHLLRILATAAVVGYLSMLALHSKMSRESDQATTMMVTGGLALVALLIEQLFKGSWTL
jgi:hypothetical protein